MSEYTKSSYNSSLKGLTENSGKNLFDRNFFNRHKLRNTEESDIIVNIVFSIFTIITIYTLFSRIEYKWDQVDLALGKQVATELFRFDLVSAGKKMEMFKALANTLALGFSSTVTGFVGGLVFAFFAARNISNKFVSTMIRGFSSVVRAVPTIIWVLIFVSGYGLSATTAVVGMFFHTLAFFIRSLSEAFEEVDYSTIEALQATGASKLQIVTGAILPSSVTRLISWFALRFEQNFATAVIIGPAVGVPGTIGTLINNASRMGNYSQIGFGILLIFIVAFVMENILNRLRQENLLD
ncbi:MAG: ABC transporter permease subunit [Finegoldia sp.]|nr:ABC transporter permease subunit [Finegoldia sp.]